MNVQIDPLNSSKKNMDNKHLNVCCVKNSQNISMYLIFESSNPLLWPVEYATNKEQLPISSLKHMHKNALNPMLANSKRA